MSLTASLKRAYLHRWHRLNVSDRCPVCGHVESFSHALCQCSFILTVWTWVLSIVNQFYFVPLVFSPSLVLFKHGLPSGNQHVKSNAIASFLFNVTLNEIWSARNLHTFEGKPFCAQAVISKIKSRIRDRIRAAYNFNFAQSFIKEWCYKNVLCTVVDKSLRVLI